MAAARMVALATTVAGHRWPWLKAQRGHAFKHHQGRLGKVRFCSQVHLAHMTAAAFLRQARLRVTVCLAGAPDAQCNIGPNVFMRVVNAWSRRAASSAARMMSNHCRQVSAQRMCRDDVALTMCACALDVHRLESPHDEHDAHSGRGHRAVGGRLALCSRPKFGSMRSRVSSCLVHM